jgi:hypothetical protein
MDMDRRQSERLQSIIGFVFALGWFGVAWVLWNDHYPLGPRIALLFTALGSLLCCVSWLLHSRSRQVLFSTGMLLFGAALLSFFAFRQ